MISIDSRKFQAHPYHMVDPSPWPISLSFSLLVMTISAVMYMHGFKNGGYLLNLGTALTVTGMALWFRDIIVESTYCAFSIKFNCMSENFRIYRTRHSKKKKE
jgi:cytochrome c oxidase subunit 3